MYKKHSKREKLKLSVGQHEHSCTDTELPASLFPLSVILAHTPFLFNIPKHQIFSHAQIMGYSKRNWKADLDNYIKLLIINAVLSCV